MRYETPVPISQAMLLDVKHQPRLTRPHHSFHLPDATWWVYSSILMAPLLGWISLALVSKPHELPMPSTKRIGATIVGILTLAMLLALLPFMGVGQFNFVKDYCMFVRIFMYL